MQFLQFILDFVLHLDRHLVELLARFDGWIYLMLALVIFAETGLVVTPFLPGDSLLFATGALAAVDTSRTLRIEWLLPLLAAAAPGRSTTDGSGARTSSARSASSSAMARWRWCCRASCRSCAPSCPS